MESLLESDELVADGLLIEVACGFAGGLALGRRCLLDAE
jgi:hypothetical protein